MSLLTWTVSVSGSHYADFGRGRYSVARTHGRASLRPGQVIWLRHRHAEIVEAIALGDADVAEQAFLGYIDQVAAENAVPEAAASELRGARDDDATGVLPR